MLAVIFCKREYYNIEYKKGCDMNDNNRDCKTL